MAEHIKLKSYRAIKRIKKDHILHEQLLSEAYILKNLRHTCIPIIYDFEEDKDYSYIIEQFIDGQSLAQFRRQWLGKIKENVIVDIGIQICDLLQYLYSLENPVLYLDLQPNNIMIANYKVKLIDFGSSLYKNQVKERRYLTGTKGFAAPELYGGEELSERTDVYGVGALLYYMVAGKNYESNTLLWDNYDKSLKTCSKRLQKIIKTCLSSNSFFRYASIEILKSKLLAISNKKVSEVNQLIKSSEPIQIAVAGSQSRIGTSHLSLLITSFLKQSNLKSIYIERNSSNHVHNIIEEEKNIKVKEGIYIINDLCVLPSYEIKMPIDISKFKFHIIDFGVLTPNNIIEYLEADIRTCILGGKEWEIEHSKKTIKMLSDKEDIKYLFNFLDSKMFIEVTKDLSHLPCYRIPYEPNVYSKQYNKNTISFIEGLLYY